MDVSTAVKQRISTRGFLDTPLPKAEVEQWLKDAQRSPSGGNLQPWRVYVINGPTMPRFLQFIDSYTKPEEPEYAVLWPRGEQTATVSDLAPRLDDLNGKTVCQLWDYLFRGDEIFPIIAQELRSRFADVRIVDFAEFGSTHGDGEAELVAALPQMLRDRGVDAVVSGMAC